MSRFLHKFFHCCLVLSNFEQSFKKSIQYPPGSSKKLDNSLGELPNLSYDRTVIYSIYRPSTTKSWISSSNGDENLAIFMVNDV